jgi:hypothetical protein
MIRSYALDKTYFTLDLSEVSYITLDAQAGSLVISFKLPGRYDLTIAPTMYPEGEYGDHSKVYSDIVEDLRRFHEARMMHEEAKR